MLKCSSFGVVLLLTLQGWGQINIGGVKKNFLTAPPPCLCRERKKLICGTEGEIVLAYGCLPSPQEYTLLQAPVFLFLHLSSF